MISQTLRSYFGKFYNLKTFVLLAFFIYFQSKIVHFMFPSSTAFLTTFALNYFYAFAVGVFLINELKKYGDLKEVKLLVVFLLWVLFLGLYNYSFNMDMILKIVLLSLVAFIIPFMLKDTDKQKFTIYLIFFTNLVLVVFAILGIYAFMINFGVRGFSVNMPPIYPHKDQSRLTIFWHPNFTAAVYSFFFILSLTLFFYFKKLYSRIFIGLKLALFFVVISLTQSRTTNISFSIAVGVIITCLILKNQKIVSIKQLIKFAIIFLVTALLLLLCFSATLSLLNGIRLSLPDLDYSTFPLVLENNDNSDINHEDDYSVGRDFSNAADFNGRTQIWSDYIQVLIEHPSTYLIGYRISPTDIFLESNRLSGNEYGAVHSEYLYCLLAFGLFGLILVLLIALFITIRIIKTIVKGEALKNNMIIYGAIFIYTMITAIMEAFIAYNLNEVYPVTFFYCCGMICALTQQYRFNFLALFKKQRDTN